MRNSLFLAAVLLAVAVPSHAQRVDRDFPMRFFAGFLQPGLGDAPVVAGDEAFLSGLQWTGAASGQAIVTVWGLNVPVRFQASADRRSLQTLATDLDSDDAKVMQVWRLRHDYGYFAGSGYYWDSIIDGRIVMDPQTGQRLDRMLRGAFRLWATNRLQAALSGQPVSQPSLPADAGQLNGSMSLRYDKNGLVGRHAGDFYIRLWGVPAHVRLRIKPHTPSNDDPFIIAFDGQPAVDFDLAELRRRYGYSDDAEFDSLLQRTAAHWAEASSYVILSGLNDDLQKAMEGLGPIMIASSGDSPALVSLQAVANGRPLQ